MNNMDTNYLLDLDFLLVVFCQEGTYSSLMSAFLHDTILPVNKGAFLRDGLNLDQSHYQNLWSLWFDTADWKSTGSGDKDWIWIKDPRWCRSWWINEFTRGRDSFLWCSLFHLLSQHDPIPNAPKAISMMFFFSQTLNPAWNFLRLYDALCDLLIEQDNLESPWHMWRHRYIKRDL